MIIKNLNWWRRRITFERGLMVISTVAAITMIELQTSMKAVGASMNHVSTDMQKSAICLTPQCIHTASEVLRKMKPEVDPCNDFYQFACGSYVERENIPDDKTSIDTFSEISDMLQLQIRDILSEEHPATDHKHFRLPRAYYKACMNTTLIESLGATPITNIAESLGGWPVIKGETWDMESTWTWQEAVKKFNRLGLGINYIFQFSVDGDLSNNTRRIIQLNQADLGLDRDFLIKGFNETLVTAYYDYMVDMAVLFGAKRETAEKELLESLEFETNLANISWPAEKLRNSNDLINLRTIKELQQTYPYIQWLDYMNAMLPQGLKVGEDELINLSVPSFFEELGPLLAKTPKRTIANYLMWRIHADSVLLLSDTFHKRAIQYENMKWGQQNEGARWKECVDSTLSKFLTALSSLYVRKHFNEEAKAITSEMVQNIRAVFNDILDEAGWMDPLTKQEAKKKLHAMVAYVGYPDELLDDEKLAEYYDKLDISEEQYLESALRIGIFQNDYSWNKLRLPLNKTEWLRHAAVADVNAYYAPWDNCMLLKAGILQGSFFNYQRPKYMNYGGIGSVIGHEIMHGFDDQGKDYDAEGNLLDWWQEDTKTEFLTKAQCIIEQYGNYTEPETGLHLNGINTQGENIADNGGTKEAYLAYNRWAAKNGVEPKLPGLDYTPQQMFWIAYGQNWCSKYRKETLKLRIATDGHSPGFFRAIGVVSNMKDFAKDFQCPDDSAMNPAKKCMVW